MKRRLHILLILVIEAVGLSALLPADLYATMYRSRATGTWTANTTWDRSVDGGLNWAAAGAGQFPSSTATDTVFVLAAHTVTMNGNPGNCRTLTVSGTITWTQARTTNVGVGGVGDLTLSGGTVSGSATGRLNVQGAFLVPVSTTSTVQRITLTVTGATTVSGTLQFTTSAAGNKTFVGAITVNSGASWTNTINEAITVRGGISNNGTFTAGTGTHTFNTNSQVISGSSPVSFGGNAAITGAITLTNNSAVSVAGNLTGSVAGSTWLNAANSSLSVTGVLLNKGTLTATESPNTVTYSGAAQTVKATTYSNLVIAGSGAKTTTGVTVTDTLSRQGTATATAAPTYQSNSVV